MKERITPEEITELRPSEIFVFGSNEAGLHGAGAAKAALFFGAEFYKGFGISGNTFAIPTKDWTIQTLPLPVIEMYVKRFIAFAEFEKEYIYLVTPVGCGLAGYEPRDIAPFFESAKEQTNIYLPQSFWSFY